MNDIISLLDLEDSRVIVEDISIAGSIKTITLMTPPEVRFCPRCNCRNTITQAKAGLPAERNRNMFEVPFADTEKICKHLCLNGSDYEPYLSGAKDPEGFSEAQIRAFREDVLTHFAREQDRVGEDVTIPSGSDVMILREARSAYHAA